MEDEHTFEHIHREHQEWKVFLLSSEKKVKNFSEEIEEKVEPKLPRSRFRQLEHLKHNLTRQRVIINDLLQKIKKADSVMSKTDNRDHVVTNESFAHNSDLRSRMVSFYRLFDEFCAECIQLKEIARI